MKRMIVIFLILCLSLNGLICTNVFADSSDEYSEEMLDISKKLLTKIGLWDETHSGDGYITRAEVARIACLLKGADATAFPIIPLYIYDDVPEEHWAYNWIHLAGRLGRERTSSYMNGDGNGKFRPDDYITYQELSKVLVLTTYWGPYVEYVANFKSSNKCMFPDIYYEIANQIGIYPLKENNKTAYVTENDAAVLLYNTIHIQYLIELMTSPEHWFSHSYEKDNLAQLRFDTYQVRGYAKVIDENKVLIDGVEYIGKIDDENFSEGLVICFYESEFYPKENAVKPIILCSPISSPDFDNQKPISDSIPKYFTLSGESSEDEWDRDRWDK